MACLAEKPQAVLLGAETLPSCLSGWEVPDAALLGAAPPVVLLHNPHTSHPTQDALAAARAREAAALASELAEQRSARSRAKQGATALSKNDSCDSDKEAHGSGQHNAAAAAVASAGTSAAPRRTLWDDWQSLLVALNAPVVWCGAIWRMFYCTCLNGERF